MGKFSVNLKFIKTILIGISLVLSFNCASLISTKPPDKNLMLIEAARKGNKSLVIKLIREGVDIDAKDKEGWTAYLAASGSGQWEVMHLLAGLGAKTDPGF